MNEWAYLPHKQKGTESEWERESESRAQVVKYQAESNEQGSFLPPAV